jgi:hypothetical protein
MKLYIFKLSVVISLLLISYAANAETNLVTRAQLLDPSVGAIKVGTLTSNGLGQVVAVMNREKARTGISQPRLVVVSVLSPEKAKELGYTTQLDLLPHSGWDLMMIWQGLADDASSYCGANTPVVYMIDGDQYTIPGDVALERGT